MSIDKNIRRVVVIGTRGEVIDDRLREGLPPLLSARDLRNFALGSAIKASMSERWPRVLGPLIYTISVRPKVTSFRFFLKEGTVVVMADSPISLTVANKIVLVLERRMRSDFAKEFV